MAIHLRSDVTSSNLLTEAMQPTVSRTVFQLLSIWHPPFGGVDSWTGLAVADLISR